MLNLLRSKSRHLRIRPFTSTCVHNDSHPDDMAILQTVLREETENARQQPTTTDTNSFVSREDHMPKRGDFKGFHEGSFMRPHQLTYKSRLPYTRPKFTRPLLGPPRALARKTDPFHLLSLDPVRECMNHDLLSAYVTKMGRIMNRRETGLTTKSQRRLGKAIRRAKMMGIIPVLSSAWIHPSLPSAASHSLSKRQQKAH